MDNSKLRYIVIFILIGLCSNYSKGGTEDLPDIDSVCNAICKDEMKKALNFESSVLYKTMIVSVHLSVEDFCSIEGDTTSMCNIPVFIENDPIYTNTNRKPLEALYKVNYMWETVRNVYGAYTRSMMDYFKNPRFVVSLKSSLRGNCLSLTVSFENFKILDKYTAYSMNIADYTYRFEYSCKSQKWIISDIEKHFYTELKKRIMHPIGAKIQ